MKTFIFVTLVFSFFQTVQAATREIVIKTAKIDNKVHWVTEDGKQKISVQPGETIKFSVKHELEGGFDVHGFEIEKFGILKKQVQRKQAFTTSDVKIPENLGAGEYKISCWMHTPAHQPAFLVVEAKKPEAKRTIN